MVKTCFLNFEFLVLKLSHHTGPASSRAFLCSPQPGARLLRVVMRRCWPLLSMRSAASFVVRRNTADAMLILHSISTTASLTIVMPSPDPDTHSTLHSIHHYTRAFHSTNKLFHLFSGSRRSSWRGRSTAATRRTGSSTTTWPASVRTRAHWVIRSVLRGRIIISIQIIIMASIWEETSRVSIIMILMTSQPSLSRILSEQLKGVFPGRAKVIQHMDTWVWNSQKVLKRCPERGHRQLN